MTNDRDNERLKDVRKLKKILKLVPADRKDIAEKLIVEISLSLIHILPESRSCEL